MRAMGKAAALAAAWALMGGAWAQQPAPAPVPGQVAVAVEGAGLPSAQWLSELERRLFPEPGCKAEQHCAQAQSARVVSEGERVVVEVEYHALARASAPLPELVGGVWEELTVQGRPAVVRALPSGGLAVRLEPGVSVARLALRPRSASLALSFAQPPKRVSQKAAGWSVELSSKASPSSVTLTRLEAPVAAPAGEPALEAPLFLSIDRSVSMEPSGSKARLRVSRASSGRAAATAWVDLQEGERVVGEQARVEGGRLRVDFAAGEDERQYETRLPAARALRLSASERWDRKESWTVSISPRLMVSFEGLKAVESGSGASVFLPFPGQSLKVMVEEQRPAPGARVAIDKASLRTEVGESGSRHELSLSARAAAASPLEIKIPAGWTLESASLNGAPAQKSHKPRALTVDAPPGAHQFDFVFSDPSGAGWVSKAPEIELGAPAANIEWTLELPASRWPLWVWGPALGPAMLAWGALLVIAALSAGLGRQFKGPCLPTAWGWMAMLAPLAALHPLAAAPVALFLMALSRKQSGAWRASDESWNLAQFGLMFLAALSAWALLSAAYSGLLGAPKMMITGNGSSERVFKWYLDRSGGAGMDAGALSAPLWMWRALMLAWALWLARAIVGRLGAMWGALCDGGLWRPAPKKAAAKKASSEPEGASVNAGQEMSAAQPAEAQEAGEGAPKG